MLKIKKSLLFYTKFLDKEPLFSNDNRWITFDCGNSLSLYNKAYDERIIEEEASENFNQAYLDDFYKKSGVSLNNIVVFNFEVEDLKYEYERLKKLKIGKISEIMYVNIHMPYWYFNIEDPDGNILEISGNMDDIKK